MNQSDILEIIIDNIRQILPGLEGHAFKPSDSMRDLGLHSIARYEVVLMTLERLSLNAPKQEFAGAASIGELARIFYAKVSQVR